MGRKGQSELVRRDKKKIAIAMHILLSLCGGRIVVGLSAV